MSDRPLPLIQHIKELRRLIFIGLSVLILASACSFLLYSSLTRVLLAPFFMNQDQTLYTHVFYEAFLVKMKISLFFGALFSLPVHLLLVVIFLLPALSVRERILMFAVLLFGMLLAGASLVYSYFYLIPGALAFLSSSDLLPPNTGNLWNLQTSVTGIVQFLFAGVVVFEIPLVLFVLMRFGMVSPRALLKSGRFVIVGAFILSAIITPPDVVSQIGVALPFIVLYYFVVLLGFLLPKRRRK